MKTVLLADLLVIDILFNAGDEVFLTLKLPLLNIFFAAEAHDLSDLLQWNLIEEQLQQFLAIAP